MNNPICSYFGCEEEVCEHDLNYPPPGMRFCQKHSEEINGFIERAEIPRIIGFWIRANGGAKRLAESM